MSGLQYESIGMGPRWVVAIFVLSLFSVITFFLGKRLWQDRRDIPEAFYCWVAWHLPRRIIFWVLIKVKSETEKRDPDDVLEEIRREARKLESESP